jgi:serine/threonine protein kinase
MSESIENKRDSDKDVVVLPYSGKRRLVSWAVSRFRLQDRKLFWIYFTFISTSVFVSSGILMNACVRWPLFVAAKMPIVGPFASNFIEGPLGERFSAHVVYLSRISPVDSLIRGCLRAVQIGLEPINNSDTVFFVGGFISVLVALILLYRAVRAPAQLLISEDGLRLAWKLGFYFSKGPLVPWSDVVGVRLRRHGGNNSPDGKIEFLYETPHWQYAVSWFQPADEFGTSRLTVDLRNLDSLELRHSLSSALERWAPLNTVPPEVMEILSATQSSTYTELWLQALTAPSKRESLEPLSPGKQLRNGSYTIEGQLGVGGQGTAYAASDKASAAGSEEAGHKISLVVKEFVLPLYVDSSSRKEALRRFLDEADLLKRLDHERVVKLSDCFVEDHRGYLVLERIHGDSLKQIVGTSGALTESRVLELLDQMLDVLSYLHGQEPPVVHRDFAPDNLILGNDGVLKLVDFNVAQQAENTVTGTIVGKQSYVPPEQLRGMATPASDIYALGATLHFLLTGFDPEPLYVSHPMEIAAHVSKELDGLVARCTQLDEVNRFKSVSEIQEYLRYINGTGSTENRLPFLI